MNRLAFRVVKTEHSGPKKGFGAYYGYKKEAKKQSNRRRRQIDKEAVSLQQEFEADDPAPGAPVC